MLKKRTLSVEMRQKHRGLLVFLVLVASFSCFFAMHAHTASADINPEINFQGKLTNPDGTNVTDGTYSIVFSIYSVSTGGTAIWTETQSSVSVASGIFQVNLGSVTTLPGSINFNTPGLYLGIKVGSDAEMSPRIQFTAAPYAFNSQSLGGVLASGYGTLAGTQTWTNTNTFNNAIAANGGLSVGGTSIISGSGVVSSTGLSGTYSNSVALTNSANTYAGSTLAITGTPTASGTASLAQFGGALSGGNSATNGGTYVSVVEPGSGAGSAADFLNFQNGSAQSVLNVTSGGAVNADTVAGGNAQGYFLRNSTPTDIAGFQALDLSGASYGFLDVNKYFNGTAWVDDGLNRLGSSFQIQNDSFTFYSFGTGTTFTPRFTVASGGNVGVGTTGTPSSLLSVGGSTGNFLVNTAGAITAATGITNAGGAVSLNASSNFNTAINTGTSTGTVSVGNSVAGAVSLQSGAAVNITGGAASTVDIGANTLSLQTTNNGAITTGSGALTIGGATSINNTAAVKITNANAFLIQTTGGSGTLFAANTSASTITVTGAESVSGNLQVGSLQIGTAQTAGYVATTNATGNISLTEPPVKSTYNSTTLEAGNTIIWTGSVTCATGPCTAILSTTGATGGPAIFTNVLSVQCTPQGVSTAANSLYCGYESYTAATKTLLLRLDEPGGALAAPADESGTVYVTVVGN
jgi:fibronectin-binding autotransporter adhesin